MGVPDVDGEEVNSMMDPSDLEPTQNKLKKEVGNKAVNDLM
jgi:hypothetical protein